MAPASVALIDKKKNISPPPGLESPEGVRWLWYFGTWPTHNEYSTMILICTNTEQKYILFLHGTSLKMLKIRFTNNRKSSEPHSNSPQEIDPRLREIAGIVTLLTTVIVGVNPSVAFKLRVEDIVHVEEEFQVF